MKVFDNCDRAKAENLTYFIFDKLYVAESEVSRQTQIGKTPEPYISIAVAIRDAIECAECNEEYEEYKKHRLLEENDG